MQISLNARSKILTVLEPGKAFRIQAIGTAETGTHVDLIPNSSVTAMDNTISHIPLVVADIQTVTFLAGQLVDYDYVKKEFIISAKGS